MVPCRMLPRECEKYEERKREKDRCRMPGRRVKGSFARVPRPLTRRTGEAAAEEV